MVKNPPAIAGHRGSIPDLDAKMGLIKDRNGMGLTEAEDIKKRWQEYTEELYKKDLQIGRASCRERV